MVNFRLVIFVLYLTSSLHHAHSYELGPNYKAKKIADIDGARGLFVDESGDILAVSNRASAIFSLTDADGTFTKTMIVDGSELGLSHGITHRGDYLYASSPSTVYRWSYLPGTRKLIESPPEIVIDRIPTGGHSTRTLIFDSDENLYVSIGSDKNIDPNSERARIRRFKLTPSKFPHDFNSGEIFADGTRNEVGLAFDEPGTLWGVENGGDNLYRPDLGGDIHNGNPGEELNRFNEPSGRHFGYPYCFSTDQLEGYEPGTQFAWPDFLEDGTHTDRWCQDAKNNVPPVLILPAHTAPLGLEFYAGQGNELNSSGAFPPNAAGDAFVAFHGSWNSDLKVGYRVSQIEFTKDGPHVPTGIIKDIIYESDLNSCRQSCFRPVNAVFSKKGHLIVSDDNNDEIIQVTYELSDDSGSGIPILQFPLLFLISFMSVLSIS